MVFKKNIKLGFGSLCSKEFKQTIRTEPHILPIYATSSFMFDNLEQGVDIFTGKQSGHVYSRYGNPTIDAVVEKIVKMEMWELDGEAYGVMFSSGMAAIHTLLLTLMKPGDKLLTQPNLYGGTTELMEKIFKPLGIGLVYVHLRNIDAVKEACEKHPDITALYCETPSNPTVECLNLKELTAVAKEFGIKTIIDNTFCTPYLQQPFKHGVDLIIHSTTKFLNGHGNSTSGIVIGRDKELITKDLWTKMKLSGTNCNPFDAWLTYNGLKTLHLRMDKHSQNGQSLAEHLMQHPAIARVNYPGLPSHPDHAVAAKQMTGFGGMLSFELNGGLDAGKRFMNQLEFCTLAPTLGDIDTLILHPATMSHVNIPRDIRYTHGITDGLIRVSVGIEDIEDIIGDIDQAIDRI